MKTPLSRRHLLQSAAGVAGGLMGARLLGGDAFAQQAEKPALLVIELAGGMNALFNSYDSFVGPGTFGANGTGGRSLGNELVVDATTFGTFDPFTLSHMATIGVRHGITQHAQAQEANHSFGGRPAGLVLASAMGGDAAIKCAVVGESLPPGVRTPVNGVSYQSITDMTATIAALGGGAADPTLPDRELAAKGLAVARTMSMRSIARSPKRMTAMTEGYDTGIETLKKPVQTFDFNAMAQAYGLTAASNRVNNFTAQMLAAELMITAGANVVIARHFDWDLHEGGAHSNNERLKMTSQILPPLKIFLSRMLNAPGRNVVVSLVGDFTRSAPYGDHGAALSATMIGKYVKTGTTGRMSSVATLPDGTPGVTGHWAAIGAALKLPTNPFGANPHAAVIL
jgi:hypothetical protein